MDHFERARQQMVLSQLKPHHIHDAAVLEAFLNIPRHLFVPSAQQMYAYRDSLVFFTKKEVLLSPATLARIIQEAQIKPEDSILLINGTTGYPAALLMQLGAHVDIWETNADFINQSKRVFKDLSLQSYRFLSADFSVLRNKKYNAVLVVGGMADIPPVFMDCLSENGKLIGILCTENMDKVVVVKGTSLSPQQTILFETKVPCLLNFEKEPHFEF